jgi:hypothetical protein
MFIAVDCDDPVTVHLTHQNKLREVKVEGIGQQPPVFRHVFRSVAFPATEIKAGETSRAGTAFPGEKGMDEKIALRKRQCLQIFNNSFAGKSE